MTKTRRTNTDAHKAITEYRTVCEETNKAVIVLDKLEDEHLDDSVPKGALMKAKAELDRLHGLRTKAFRRFSQPKTIAEAVANLKFITSDKDASQSILASENINSENILVSGRSTTRRRAESGEFL
jgi:hypothetical protein